jgi:hypothetical protein
MQPHPSLVQKVRSRVGVQLWLWGAVAGLFALCALAMAVQGIRIMGYNEGRIDALRRAWTEKSVRGDITAEQDLDKLVQAKAKSDFLVPLWWGITALLAMIGGLAFFLWQDARLLRRLVGGAPRAPLPVPPAATPAPAGPA